MCVNLAIDILLDGDIFLHGFDDPVAIIEPGQVVFQVAASDQATLVWEHEAGRGAFPLFLDGRLGERIAVGGCFGNHVQQDDFHPGVGHLRRDPAAHDACADDGDLFDISGGIVHETDLSVQRGPDRDIKARRDTNPKRKRGKELAAPRLRFGLVWEPTAESIGATKATSLSASDIVPTVGINGWRWLGQITLRPRR